MKQTYDYRILQLWVLMHTVGAYLTFGVFLGLGVNAYYSGEDLPSIPPRLAEFVGTFAILWCMLSFFMFPVIRRYARNTRVAFFKWIVVNGIGWSFLWLAIYWIQQNAQGIVPVMLLLIVVALILWGGVSSVFSSFHWRNLMYWIVSHIIAGLCIIAVYHVPFIGMIGPFLFLALPGIVYGLCVGGVVMYLLRSDSNKAVVAVTQG